MSAAPIEIGVAQLTMAGEHESGDRWIVKTSPDRALVGVIDGLGHGARAAEVAETAVGVIDAYWQERVDDLMLRCHEQLSGSRGAVLTLMEIDCAQGRLTWVGAGNVATAVLQREPLGWLNRTELLVRSGVAGARLPSAEPSKICVRSGDLIVAATDGVRPSFIDGLEFESPQGLADRLLQEYRTDTDDALVVVIRVGAREQ